MIYFCERELPLEIANRPHFESRTRPEPDIYFWNSI